MMIIIIIIKLLLLLIIHYSLLIIIVMTVTVSPYLFERRTIHTVDHDGTISMQFPKLRFPPA